MDPTLLSCQETTENHPNLNCAQKTLKKIGKSEIEKCLTLNSFITKWIILVIKGQTSSIRMFCGNWLSINRYKVCSFLQFKKKECYFNRANSTFTVKKVYHYWNDIKFHELNPTFYKDQKIAENVSSNMQAKNAYPLIFGNVKVKLEIILWVWKHLSRIISKLLWKKIQL